MDESLNPNQRNGQKPRNLPLSKDVFYANGVNIDVNPNEITLTFDRLVPGAEPVSTTVVMNPQAVYQLRDGFAQLAKQHEESLKKMKETGYYGEPPQNN
ncbi:DUF3467 domain-containing protein [Salinicoccus carnicancri]|uniref:DUF3467 domain-containing protein n=1 Tax=Salinicoccus carnicancri TaxID=558170 RepID=UPI0003654638|nr:DUF3467 domain-containing protein [Salinicoccus carnicancri]